MKYIKDPCVFAISLMKDSKFSIRLRAAIEFSDFVHSNPEVYPVEQDGEALAGSCKPEPPTSASVAKVLGPITQRQWRKK
jgi:hypothetical protein